ncbi:MAG: hypothetical protein K2X55_10150 [Burkholderiaceae bacterium]|nr:hypothetical protein [Burkholderiaceae bacterium]
MRRNGQKAHERMIEDHEYQNAFALAEPSVRRMMTLIYRTCQRPKDLLGAGIQNVKMVEHEGREVRVLRIRQGKMG